MGWFRRHFSSFSSSAESQHGSAPAYQPAVQQYGGEAARPPAPLGAFGIANVTNSDPTTSGPPRIVALPIPEPICVLPPALSHPHNASPSTAGYSPGATNSGLASPTGSSKSSPQAAGHRYPAVSHFFDTAHKPQAAPLAQRFPAVQYGGNAGPHIAMGIPANPQPCNPNPQHPVSFEGSAANNPQNTTSSSPSTPTTPSALAAIRPRPPFGDSQTLGPPPQSQGSAPGSGPASGDLAPPPLPQDASPPRSPTQLLLETLSSTLAAPPSSRLGRSRGRASSVPAPPSEPLRASSSVALPALPDTGQLLEAAINAGLGSQGGASGAAGDAAFGQHPYLTSVRPVPATELAESRRRPSRRANSSAESQLDSSPPPQRSRSALEDWQIRPDQLEFLTGADGSPWQLGSGAFGCVEKARLNGVEFVAIKALKCYSVTDTMRDTRARANFEREVEILSSCRHRNVVSFLGTATGRGGELLLVTEFCEGADLFRALARDLDETLCWAGRGRAIALDIARGLVYLHARGIVHLDLKSPNVLLDGHGVAKIADVGLAKLLSGTAVTATAAGTFAWASPEQLFGRRCNDKADIWSFGVILWEIATGEPPTSRAMRPLRLPEECPAEIDALIKRCTDPDPALRPTAKQAFDIIAALQ